MQTESLSQIKQQIISLDDESKRELADFLAGELNPADSVESRPVMPVDERQNELEWLKANRESYAGKYVALSGAELVGVGTTIREAVEGARQNGHPEAFVTFVYSENDLPFGGW